MGKYWAKNDPLAGPNTCSSEGDRADQRTRSALSLGCNSRHIRDEVPPVKLEFEAMFYRLFHVTSLVRSQ